MCDEMSLTDREGCLGVDDNGGDVTFPVGGDQVGRIGFIADLVEEIVKVAQLGNDLLHKRILHRLHGRVLECEYLLALVGADVVDHVWTGE